MRFAEADTRRWVIAGSVIGAVAYAVLTAVNLAWGRDAWHTQVALMLAALGCITSGVLARRGAVFAGGLVGLGALWCQVQYSLLCAVRFPSPSLLVTAPVLVVAALLLLPRYSAIIAIVTVVLTWPLVMLSPAVQGTGVTPNVVYWLVAHAVVTLGVWLLVMIAFAIVDRTFLEVLGKERALAETINKAPDGILVIDADELVQMANPAAERMLGLQVSDCIGRGIGDVLHAVNRRAALDVGTLFGDSGERPRDLTLRRDDGEQLEIEITWRTMDAGRRQLVLRDVSERRRADQVRREMDVQLAHAQRLEAVGQLAGGIAHDFNNLLTIIGASAEVLRLDLTDEQHAPLIDEILAAQDRGSTLTRQLLAFARRDVVQPRVFDLSAHVLTLRRLLQRVAGEQTRIACDVEPDCRVRADLGQVEQALVNLVSNARDAMPEGGDCRISVVKMTNDDGEQWVRLRVSDVGVGMDAATSLRAFEPFFTTKPRGRGTGLGLSSVHGIVLQSGGRADIDSMPGRGTTVLLEFPFANAPSTDAAPRVASEPIGGGATILVAEDDDGTRATVNRVLRRLGYTVLLAPDGMQALRLAETHAGQIDLLLTDVMMPGMSGPQLATRLGVVAPTVPVIYMSGYPEDALAEVSGLNLQTDFIAKPFSSVALAERIADKLASTQGTTGDS